VKRFYLGAHHADWLNKADVPLFISATTLKKCKTLPRASAPWALDSGGFTELSLHGAYRSSAREYASTVRTWQHEIGKMDFAAPQDWMCEVEVLERTGLSVPEHQARTTRNYIELVSAAPDVPWMPVLQGWTHRDYWQHVDAYYAAGVDLAALPRVGVGTVCKRQKTMHAALLLSLLSSDGFKLHGFGFKLTGLRAAADYVESADSMAWSYGARYQPPIPGHTHKSCSNCLEYALEWRASVADLQREGSSHGNAQ
jgi:hypothetical protein